VRLRFNLRPVLAKWGERPILCNAGKLNTRAAIAKGGDMGKARAFFGLTAAVALSAGALLVATGAAVGAPGDKVDITICHANNDVKKPYVLETPNTEGQLEGHADHTGPIFNAANPPDPQDGWGDIIPPFGDGVLKDGLNWTAGGQAILNNGCEIPFGDVTVTKAVVDPSGQAVAGQTYSITLSCSFEGSPVLEESVSLAGGATSDAFTDIQGGTLCTATEDTTGIANLASSVVTDATVAGDSTVTVTVTNTYNAVAPANEAAPVTAPAKFTG
jgi:Domain of unknown function (DUF5979)